MNQKQKMFMVIAMLFLVPLTAFVHKASAAEYWEYPLTATPNYVEPSTFDTTVINYDDAYKLGSINLWSALEVCFGIKSGDTIILGSGGGFVQAGYDMMNCLKDKDVTIAVEAAYSMATMVMLAGSKVCLFEDAPIGFHQPYRVIGGEVVYHDMERLAQNEANDRVALLALGYTVHKITYLNRFSNIARDAERLAMMSHGTMAGILGDRFAGRCEYEGE